MVNKMHNVKDIASNNPTDAIGQIINPTKAASNRQTRNTVSLAFGFSRTTQKMKNTVKIIIALVNRTESQEILSAKISPANQPIKSNVWIWVYFF